MSDKKLNTGYYNTGHRNTGNCNAGDWSTGDCNAGDWSTGDGNTGDGNTGDRNTGDMNTGDRNTGDRNTGDWNTGNFNTGDCNTNEPTVRIFNHDSGWEFFGKDHKRFKNTIRKYSKPLCDLVPKSNMSEKEKEENPTYKITGGYLKENKNLRNDKPLEKEDRDFLLSVPNFNADILLETTGIDINES